MPLSSRSDWFLRVVSVNTPRTQPSFVAGSGDFFHTPARLHDDAGKRLYQAYMTDHSCCITVFHLILLKTPDLENGGYNKFAQNGRLQCAILHHKLTSYIIAGLFDNVSSCFSWSSWDLGHVSWWEFNYLWDVIPNYSLWKVQLTRFVATFMSNASGMCVHVQRLNACVRGLFTYNTFQYGGLKSQTFTPVMISQHDLTCKEYFYNLWTEMRWSNDHLQWR